jgi:para-nitrobenzyl esterase
MRLAVLAFVLAACAGPPPRAPTTDPLVVTTDRGPIIGRAEPGVRAFLGVPYASAARWKPPVAHEAWSRPRDATRPGPACAQPDVGGFHRDSAEDCLTVNVWVPDGATKAPVMVWIHGGAFYLGSASDALYDGAKLARRTGAIVIAIEYRLGALGFLSTRELAAENGRAAAPAFGLLDQQAALAWVQRNAAAFGGDPANVTIFGESAGAWSVCSHLVMPGSRGLFARAIMQSGACSDALYFDPDAANAQGDELAAAVGCTGDDRLACLRATPIDTITHALPYKRGMLLHPGVWWGPIVDGVSLPRLPLVAMRAGEVAKVPLVIGWAQDEGTIHTMTYDQVSPDEFAGFVRDVLGEAAVATAVAHYTRGTPKDALTDVVTEGIFACNDRRVARVLAAQGVPVFEYEWTRALDDPKAHPLGATHSVDLWFVFGNRDGDIGLSDAEKPLSAIVMDAWGRFARAGDPSGPGLAWPRYDVARDELLVLDLAPRAAAHVKQDICDVWDRFDRTVPPPVTR